MKGEGVALKVDGVLKCVFVGFWARLRGVSMSRENDRTKICFLLCYNSSVTVYYFCLAYHEDGD